MLVFSKIFLPAATQTTTINLPTDHCRWSFCSCLAHLCIRGISRLIPSRKFLLKLRMPMRIHVGQLLRIHRRRKDIKIGLVVGTHGFKCLDIYLSYQR